MADIVPLDRVKRAFQAHTFVVHDRQSSIDFLRSKDLSKSNTSRYISWMILFNGIPEDPELWPLTFYHIIRSYRSKLDYYLKDPNKKVFNIPKCLDDKTTDAIRSDVHRATNWFRRFALTVGNDQKLIDDQEIETRIVRFICIMLSEAPQFHYNQGYERFAFVSFSLSLYLSVKLGLGLIEAEAFSVPLFRRIIGNLEIDSFLSHESSMMQYFSDIDAYLMNTNREMMDNLMKEQISSAQFAANWVCVLFSDSHTPLSCLLIWDHFWLHQKDSKQFLNALISAHLKQIELLEDASEQMNAIQQFGDWNVENIIDEAENQMIQPIIRRVSVTGFTAFWL
ncbi:hypothetical protein M9Y10_027881 [Tritrichomonas musculus]|uniref:Rab-GAP TBC domain-containing protein n=1 Tax=Tritrichomonas musculus TaxID=1915356 RepID=A0ABR2H494_9EUKA